MRSSLAFCLALLFFAGKIFPQTPLWQWAVQIASPGNEQGLDLSTDSNGNVVICGSYDGNLGFVFGSIFSTPVQKDGYVAKYSPAGTLLLAFRIGGNGNDEVTGICHDSLDNIYVTGHFEGTCDFDPALLSTYNLTSAGGRDGFLAKYSSSGSLIWAIRFGGTANEEGRKVARGPGGVYLCGNGASGTPFFSTSSTTLSAAASEAQSNFIAARYNTAGVVQWVVSAGSSGPDLGLDLTADNSRVYFTGNYQGSLNIYNASATTAATLAAQTLNKSNVFVLAYNSTGTLAWATNASSGDDDFGYGICQDSSRIYIAGGFKNNFMSLPYPSPTHTIASAGGYDIYLAALLKSNGSYQWVSQQTGSTASDEVAYVLETEKNGNLVLGAGFKGAISYSAFGGPTFSSLGNEDILISSFTNSGVFLWTNYAGGGNIDRPYGICSSTSGAVYVCGEHANGVNFGTITLANAVGKNTFVAKTGCEEVSNNFITGSQTVCAGASPTLFTGSVPSGNSGAITYRWELSTNSVTWAPAPGTYTGQNYASLPPIDTVYYRRVVISNGACLFPGNTIKLSVDQPPTVAVAAGNQTLCSATSTITANMPSSGTGSWSLVSGSVNIGSTAAFSTTISSISTGLNILAWTITNGVCPASSATLSVQRDASPGPLNAGFSQTICAPTATLAAATLTAGTGSWSVLSGSASISASNNPGTSLSGLGTGTNVLQWTITNGVCPANSATIAIVRDPLPSPAITGPTQSVCTSVATITATSPTTGTGSWSVLSGGSTLSATASTLSVAGNLQTGTNVFLWTVSSGVCAPVSATTAVVRHALPTVASAGPSQSVCGGSATLAANSPVTGSGSWSLVSGNGVFTSPASPASAVNTLSPGLNVFLWNIQNGVCPPSTSTVSITSYLPPSNVAVIAAQTLCASGGTISAAVPASGSGTWSALSSSVNIASPLSPTTAVNSLAEGQNIFIWTVGNGVCAPLSATTTITRDAMPDAALAGNDQTVCAAMTTLQASQPSTGTGSWTALTTPAQVLFPGSYSTAVNNLATGENKFVWTVSSGVCPPSTSTVTIQRDTLPDIAFAGTDQTVCASVFTLSAKQPLTGTGNWQSLGQGLPADQQAYNTTVSGLAEGINLFVWQVSNGVCPPSADTVTIFSETPPSEPLAGEDQRVCTVSVTLNANTPEKGNGYWKVLQGGAVLSSSTAVSVTAQNLGHGKNIFTWTTFNGSCPEKTDTVLISRDKEPDEAIAGPDQAVCGNTVTVSGNSPATGSPEWSILTGEAQINNPSQPLATLSQLPEGELVMVYRISNGVCAVRADTTKIQVFHAPGPLNEDEIHYICSPVALLAAATPTAGHGMWSVISGAGEFDDPGSPNSLVRQVAIDTNQYRWTLSNGICESSSAVFTVILDTAREQANAGEDLETELYYARLDAVASEKSQGKWVLVAGEGSIGDVSDPATLVTGLGPGKNVFRWILDLGECGETSDEVIIYRQEFMIPNGISPNGDGKNDVFYITGLENYSPVKLTIFNRWGHVVYENHDYRNNWQGTNMRHEVLVDDTYYYVMEIPGKDTFTGFITVKSR